MAKIVWILSTTFLHLVAPLAPILTWSSWPLLDSIESTLDGVAYCLFWLTMLAAVYWGIIKPLFNPGLETKKGGKCLCPETNWYVLRSEIFPNSAIAMAKKSSVNANGWPWKLPPEIIWSFSTKILGLSVTELISVKNVFVTNLIVSFVAPWTCGTQRNEYGSWTCCLSWLINWLSCKNSSTLLAVFNWPLCGRTKCTNSLNGSILPSKASKEIVAIKSDKYESLWDFIRL